MASSAPQSALARPQILAAAATLLLVVTVALGVSLGLQTKAQFREVEASWADYAQGAERKGALISEVRGYLGYGGIIHNFKNYVLRQEPSYLTATRAQIALFRATVAEFAALPLTAREVADIAAIERTILAYEARLPIAVLAAEEAWPPPRTDNLVRIDDTDAIAALLSLERQWRALQAESTRRIQAAVGQGKTLIWIGFLSVAALVLSALVLGTLLAWLVRDLRRAVGDLGYELAERRKIEEAQARLATIVEQIPATILMTGTDARIEYANRKFEELTGWTRAEIKGQTPAFLQSGDTEDEGYRQIRAELAAGRPWRGVFRNLRKDGSSYWAETNILPLKAPDGSVQNFVGIGEDITEARLAREQVVRAQKLEAVGQLAGGVAHDFNNILTTIVGASHLASLDATPGSDLAHEIDQIGIAARRAQSLVRELLTFARREPGDLQPVDLRDVMAEVATLLRASLPPVIRIEVPDSGPQINVMGDPTHLHQIVMNLCRNAAEAMAGAPGTVRVTLALCPAPEGVDGRAEAWAKLDVADDGPGMTPDTMRHLFEPFFTTKPLGKGSGLGLAVVHGLVEELGGRITVESAPGEGARFSVALPTTSEDAAKAIKEAGDLPRGHERVLLIDDEAEVAGTFRRQLLRLGYRVEAFTSPNVAFERFRAAPDKFDLAITDIVMPDMTGDSLARAMREIRPDLPVIFCSGYTPKAMSLPGPLPEILEKPVEPDRLARQVRAVLDTAQTHPAPMAP
ncbi:MAG: ATP-binding protein [Pseudomonadota bacterium]